MGGSPLLTGVLYMVVAVGAPVTIYLVGFRWLPAVFDALVERRNVRRARDRVDAPSVESAVANLRRLRRELKSGPQPNRVRHLALQQAYDATLITVCGYVEVEAPLDGAVGSDRPFARLLTESELERAGIALDPPGPTQPRAQINE